MTNKEKATFARSAILDAIKQNPMRTVRELTEIGQCSRQRVHVILKEEGLELPSFAEIREARGLVIQPKSRANINGLRIAISHSAAGTVGELLVAADLITRGWSVFFPLVRTLKCDLLVLSADGQRTARIEVRSGKRVGNGLTYNRKPNDSCDHYAVLLEGEPVMFIPEIGPGKETP